MKREFIPKSYFYLRKNYSLPLFKKDFVAGITVGAIALPLAMAFSIASGLSPMQGIVTAIIAGFLISLLGGSRAQIGGPTGAFVVLVYEIVQRSGYEGLALSTLIGGVLLILFGLFRLGSWIKYIPYPLITGFTTGIAVIIFSSQVKDVVQTGAALSLGGGTLLFIIGVRRFFPKLPWGILAIVLATLISSLFALPVETILSRFGEIPSHLPLPSLPSFAIPQEQWSMILWDGIAIALLGGIESLLSAVIGDGMMGSRHKSNCELVGQGIANIGSILFGGIPATGAIARTATNIKTGAQTPLAGMIHALTLLLIVLCLAPWVSLIPMPALAAVLIVVAWNMAELPHFLYLLRAPLGDAAILLLTFLLTLFVDITIAITFGMILSSFLFMRRMSESVKTVQLTALLKEPPGELGATHIPPDVDVYEIQGPFFFGSADILRSIHPSHVLILRMRQVGFIDASGVHALREFLTRCHKGNIRFYLSECSPAVEKTLHKMGFVRLLGKHNIFPHFSIALESCNERK